MAKISKTQLPTTQLHLLTADVHPPSRHTELQILHLWRSTLHIWQQITHIRLQTFHFRL